MDSVRLLLLLAFAVFLLGCPQQTVYVCWDGSQVSDATQCPAPSTEPITPQPSVPVLQPNGPIEIKSPICVNQCGNGICQEIVCLGSGCPCAETFESCPADCGTLLPVTLPPKDAQWVEFEPTCNNPWDLWMEGYVDAQKTPPVDLSLDDREGMVRAYYKAVYNINVFDYAELLLRLQPVTCFTCNCVNTKLFVQVSRADAEKLLRMDWRASTGPEKHLAKFLPPRAVTFIERGGTGEHAKTTLSIRDSGSVELRLDDEKGSTRVLKGQINNRELVPFAELLLRTEFFTFGNALDCLKEKKPTCPPGTTTKTLEVDFDRQYRPTITWGHDPNTAETSDEIVGMLHRWIEAVEREYKG